MLPSERVVQATGVTVGSIAAHWRVQ